MNENTMSAYEQADGRGNDESRCQRRTSVRREDMEETWRPPSDSPTLDERLAQLGVNYLLGFELVQFWLWFSR